MFLRNSFVLCVKLPVIAVIAFVDEAAPLLYAYVIIPPIERVQVSAASEAQFEAHLRVAHEVTVLFAVVRYRDAQAGRTAPTRPVASMTSSMKGGFSILR